MFRILLACLLAIVGVLCVTAAVSFFLVHPAVLGSASEFGPNCPWVEHEKEIEEINNSSL